MFLLVPASYTCISEHPTGGFNKTFQENTAADFSKPLGRGITVSENEQWTNEHVYQDRNPEFIPRGQRSRPYYRGCGVTVSHQQPSVERTENEIGQRNARGHANRGHRGRGYHRGNLSSSGNESVKRKGRGIWNAENCFSDKQQPHHSALGTQHDRSNVDTGVEIWIQSMKENSNSLNESKTKQVHSDRLSDNDTTKLNTETKKPADASVDATDRWVAKTLHEKPAWPSAEEIEQILTQLETMWDDSTQKTKSHVSQYLTFQFTQSVNPFALVVGLVSCSSDSHVAKTTTLAYHIMREFEKFWKLNHSRLTSGNFLDENMKMQIFDVCTRPHMTMFDIAVKCFDLCYHGNDQFLPGVKKFVEKRKYKEVS